LELCRNNPSSSELFSSNKIVLENASVLEKISDFSDNFFDAILHDPPVISIAGELYGRPFYRELYRVLKHGGKLYHYTGLTGKKSGKDIVSSTMNRLEEVGFKNLKKFEEPAGIVCQKI
jgi:predicted methyltransferase